VQLGREPDLHVADALGLAVLGQLEGRALQGLGGLQGGHGVGEAFEILGQVLVAGPEDLLAHALLGLRGQRDLPVARQLDEGRQAQRTVEVEMQVGLRKSSQQLGLHASDYP
jgi:hypothetical protein